MASVSIKFLHNSSPYNAGDVAGFPQRIADKYVSQGFAQYMTTAVQSAPIVKVQEPKPEPSLPAPVEAAPAEPKPEVKAKAKTKAKKKKKKKVRAKKQED